MTTQRILFTEWTPDQPSIIENLSVAKNVIPAANGYMPFPSGADYSNAASESLNNVFAGMFSSTTTIFAGGPTKLLRFNSATLNMDDVSKTGGYSSVVKWKFVQFGNTIIAANNVNKLQSYTIGSSSTFGDLSSDAPIANCLTVVRDFVVAANINSGTNANRVQWCDINNVINWTSGPTSQADHQDIPDGGNIKNIVGGEFGLVLLERAIVRMSYIGTPLIFQFDTISRGLGCLGANSVVKYGNMTYFLGQEGFYSCDGQNVTPIGSEKVDRWFFDNSNPSSYASMSATVDPINKIVIWNFANSSGGRSLLIYNWQVNKWSHGETDVNYISTLATAGVTLEGLDAYGNMNTITTSFDDNLWSGGKLLLAGTRGSKLVTFTGANSGAQIVTGDIGSELPSAVTLARPIVDNGSATIALASRTLLNTPIIFGSDVSADNENRVSLRGGGKYHRFSVKPTGPNWKNAIGIDINIVNRGGR